METFAHVRIVMGMIVSMGLTHMLRGLASVIQHPSRKNTYPIHLAWVASLVLYILQFWWWEFSLRNIAVWTFGVYLYLIFYAFIIYLMCSMLFPDSLRDYADFRDYFLSRRKWFFGLLLVIYLADIGDSWIKGDLHVAQLGTSYWLKTFIECFCCAVATRTRNQLFHAGFVSLNLVAQLLFVAQTYWSSGR
jgi:hypothetical protein